MTHDAINDYKHLEREVKAVDFALTLALDVAIGIVYQERRGSLSSA